MARFINRIGERFERLLVTAEGKTDALNKKFWICQCDCGNEIEVRADALTSEKTRSCGCLQKDELSLRKVHGYRYGSDDYKTHHKDLRLQRKYGITLEDYFEIIDRQDGQCAICSTDISELDHTAHLDHCHETGRVRGVLCRRCNTGIGMLDDSADLLIKAAEYLNNMR